MKIRLSLDGYLRGSTTCWSLKSIPERGSDVIDQDRFNRLPGQLWNSPLCRATADALSPHRGSARYDAGILNKRWNKVPGPLLSNKMSIQKEGNWRNKEMLQSKGNGMTVQGISRIKNIPSAFYEMTKRMNLSRK